jgi:hypothetical protein
MVNLCILIVLELHMQLVLIIFARIINKLMISIFTLYWRWLFLIIYYGNV